MATTGSYKTLLKMLTICSKIVGVEVWTAPGQFRPASFYLSFQVIVYFVSIIYTLRKYSDDPILVLKVLITLGTAVQLYAKFFIGIRKGVQWKEYIDLVEKHLLTPFQCGSIEEVAVLQRTSRFLWILFRLMSISILSTGFVFGLYPILGYYANGVIIPLFPYELPYYDWSTTLGYATNMLFQVNIYALGTAGAIFSDFLFIMYAVFALSYTEIFMVHVGELKKSLNDPEMEAKEASVMYQQWRQCMYDHQQSVRFLNTIGDLFETVVLIQVAMGVFSMCIGMLLVALTDWYAAYFFLMIVFFELSLYFLIGHFVDLKVDTMYETINSIPWYRMPVTNQKEFSYLVCRQQRPLILTIYGFAPLNFVTYTSILRRLYQLFVMIMQYVK